MISLFRLQSEVPTHFLCDTPLEYKEDALLPSALSVLQMLWDMFIKCIKWINQENENWTVKGAFFEGIIG